jgi:hypothetical protein
MEWFIFWAVVNFFIGYAIGKPKGEAGASAMICVLLGPIGWIIAFLSTGNMRTCPFCAESVRPEAKVCKHCHRDLPAEVRQAPAETWSPSWGIVAVILFIVAIFCLFAWFYSSTLQAPATESVTNVSAPSTPSPSVGRYVSIKRSVRVNIPRGEVIIPAGDRVKLLSAQGSTVNVDYDGYSVPIPASAVDLSR